MSTAAMLLRQPEQADFIPGTADAIDPAARALPSKIRFTRSTQTGFYRAVKLRVNDYFAASGKSRFADWSLAVKGTFYAASLLIAYALILSGRYGAWTMLALANLYGVSTLLLAINVAHDAAHDALTPDRRVNRIIQTVIFTLLGANAYLWRMRHVKSHHTFPNVNGCDIDIDQNAFLRLSPNHTGHWYHRFQHLYAPFIFWLVDVHTVFYQDFVYLFKRRLANMTEIKHPVREYVLFAACKLAYLAITVIIPSLVLPMPWWQVVVGAATMSFVSSVLFVVLLIGTHFSMETEFPEFDERGYIGHDWAIHAMVTSVDWSPTSRFANFIAGGANAHAAHHLFPTVCHVHYGPITKIIESTAAEFGVRYNRTTLPRLVASHFRFLKAMGRLSIAPPAAPSGIRAPG